MAPFCGTIRTRPFGFELKQRLADRDAADAIGLAKRILAQLRSGRIGAVEDCLPELVDDRSRQGAMLQRHFHPIFRLLSDSAGRNGPCLAC